VGGIHGSVDACTIESDDDYAIIDVDVVSYYTSIGIANVVYPEHIGPEFCKVQQALKDERLEYLKKTPENLALKLALNTAYGNSNNPHSVFYDPQYTMTITINGQLLLCLLADYLMDVPELQMIQINTDGLTFKVPRNQMHQVDHIKTWWEKFTCLDLEQVEYNRMFIRDVNSYIAEGVDGSIKRKSCYAHELKPGELEWHQNHSALVVAKVAEQVLLHGADVRQTVINHPDIMDFMSRAKIPRASQLVLTTGGKEEILQNTTRYYVSTDGGALTKYSPPPKGCVVGEFKRANKLSDDYYYSILASIIPGTHDPRIHTKNESRYAERRDSIEKGWLVTECNDIAKASRLNVNYEYYIEAVRKIVDPLIKLPTSTYGTQGCQQFTPSIPSNAPPQWSQ